MQRPVEMGMFQSDIAPDRRDPSQNADRAVGRVVSCDGARATIASTIAAASQQDPTSWNIGRLLSISAGRARLVAMVFKVHTLEASWNDQGENLVHIEVELLGEVVDAGPGRSRFQGGISTYPPVGAIAHRIRATDLALVHDLGARGGVAIGSLVQDPDLPATVSVDDMCARHFAVLGTTGVGKSTAVALLLRKAVAVKPRLRVLILDPHNEYARAFPELGITIDSETLDLPFWMFRFEEFAEAVFRGRPALDEELDILRETVAMARARNGAPVAQNPLRELSSPLLKRPLDLGASRKQNEAVGSVETTTPYRYADLIGAIEELIGLHELRYSRAALKSLKLRIETLHADPRYQFMFARANMIETMAPVLGKIFRLPLHGRPICVFQLGGLPSEVVNAVASVLSRLAFDLALASQGSYEVLLLCEEAHRYVPSDPALGFVPTRQALARIAKEGRKYGAYLGVVTQRPGELDPTILSQCSTVFAMRLANDRDQQIVRAAIADASASTINFLSALGNREAIAFGEGVATTMRMRFAEVPRHELPAMMDDASLSPRRPPDADLSELLRRMGA